MGNASGLRVHDKGHTRLCRWIVYSRATTSLMAERDFFGADVFFDCVFGLSFAIATVCLSFTEGQWLVHFICSFLALIFGLTCASKAREVLREKQKDPTYLEAEPKRQK